MRNSIFDDVSLFAAPKVHIFDWFATTDLDKSYTNARLDLSIDIKNYSDKPKNDYLVKATLYDTKRNAIKTITSDKVSVLPGNKQRL